MGTAEDEHEEYITTGEAARILGDISPEWVRKLIEAKKLTARRVPGGWWRIRKRDVVDRWEGQRVGIRPFKRVRNPAENANKPNNPNNAA